MLANRKVTLKNLNNLDFNDPKCLRDFLKILRELPSDLNNDRKVIREIIKLIEKTPLLGYPLMALESGLERFMLSVPGLEAAYKKRWQEFMATFKTT